MKTTQWIAALGMVMVAAAYADFGTLSFKYIGFQTPDGIILVNVETGAVTWPKGPPKAAAAREFWDQVALSKSAKPIGHYGKEKAVADWNEIVSDCRRGVYADGNASDRAQRLWLAIKILFPGVSK